MRYCDNVLLNGHVPVFRMRARAHDTTLLRTITCKCTHVSFSIRTYTRVYFKEFQRDSEISIARIHRTKEAYYANEQEEAQLSELASNGAIITINSVTAI